LRKEYAELNKKKEEDYIRELKMEIENMDADNVKLNLK